MANLCPACGAPCSPGEKFCQNCGSRLPESAPAAPVNEAPAAPVNEAPAAPVPPAAPVNEAPAAPAYEAPAAPVYPAAENYPPAPNYQPMQGAPVYAPNGMPNYAPQGYPAPAYPGAPAPVAPPKKKKTGLIIGLCAGIAVLLAAAVLLYFFVFTPQSVSLSADSLHIKANTSTQLTAEINPGSAFLSKDVTWTSSDESVAVVSEDGTVNARKPGSCDITAATANGKSATCAVTVEVDPTALSLSESAVQLEIGDTVTLIPEVLPAEATNYTVTWTSDDTLIATVSDGRITAVGNGACTITAAVSDSVKATCAVTVGVAATGIDLSDYWVELNVGDTQTLYVEIFPDNATNYTVTWTSDDPSVAAVSDGEITAVGEGDCTVTASISDDIYVECYVTVTDRLADSEYDEYILGDWRLTLSYDWDTGIDTPVGELGLSGSLKINSDHTARLTVGTETIDVTWGFDELSDYNGISRYGFFLYFNDEEDSYYSFDYIVDSNEIWLYLDDIDITYTFER